MRVLAFLLLALAAALPLHAETLRIEGERVAIFNLAGAVRLVPGTGDAVEVELSRGGADGAALRPEIIQRRIGTHGFGAATALVLHYPSDRIRYPGFNGSSSLRLATDGTFHDGGHGRQVSINGGALGLLARLRGSGGEVEAHADLLVRVPPGRSVAIFLAAGQARADGLRADLVVSTGAAPVTVNDHEGRLVADTGSGAVRLNRVMGDVLADTGSGSVELGNIEGSRITADTGSGRVAMEGLRGDRLHVDTGSGSVSGTALDFRGHVLVDTGSGSIQLQGVTAGSLRADTGSGTVGLDGLVSAGPVEVDTGSGSVRGKDVRAPTLRVDTGSGAVVIGALEAADIHVDTGSGRVGLDLVSAPARTRIDTGSGGIELTLPADYSADANLRTRSGRIHSDLPMQGELAPRQFSGRVGTDPGSAASLQVSAGSGSIRLGRR